MGSARHRGGLVTGRDWTVSRSAVATQHSGDEFLELNAGHDVKVDQAGLPVQLITLPGALAVVPSRTRTDEPDQRAASRDERQKEQHAVRLVVAVANGSDHGQHRGERSPHRAPLAVLSVLVVL